MQVGLGVSPLAQGSLDEALGLAISLRRVGFGADVFEAKPVAELAESKGLITGAIVGHDALDLDAETFVVGESSLKESGGAMLSLADHDLGEGEA